MSAEQWITLSILGGTLAGMIWSRWRLDTLALLMLVLLGFSGVLSPTELFTGFSDPVVISIAALFVVGQAIQNSGLAQQMGQGIIAVTGTREAPLRIGLILCVALLSGLMSSTGTLSIFLPIALALAQQANLHPGRFLMPMAFAAFVGGMLTLIGTPPNLIVNTTLKEAGLASFGFFSFSGPGLLALTVLILYFTLAGRFLLPGAKSTPPLPRPIDMQDLIRDYQLNAHWHWFRIPQANALTEHPLGTVAPSQEIQILCVQGHHRHSHLAWCHRDTQLTVGDLILVQGSDEAIAGFATQHNLAPVQTDALPEVLKRHQQGIAEVMLLPRSAWIGKSLKEIDFRNRYHLHVTHIVRQGGPIQGALQHVQLRFADVLLVQGSWKHLAALKQSRHLLLLNPPDIQSSGRRHAAPITLGWILLMLALLIFSGLPMSLVILMVGLGLVVTRCLSMEEAYRSISWESILLIAAMFPMATALHRVGLMDQWVHGLQGYLQGLSVAVILGLLFGLTSALSLILSNTATTVLMAPVALQLAQNLNGSPQAFLMTVALAASSAFASPLASPVNLMVMGQGNYAFKDYVKAGLPLQVLMLVVLVGAVYLFY